MSEQRIPPVPFTWDGEAMRPAQPRLADQFFVIGQRYRLVEHHDRSTASHNAFFAAVAEAHANLPDELTLRWPTPDHLRKWLLIKAGYRDERTLACGSKAMAARVAAFARPLDEYAVVALDGPVVHVLTAQSQSYAAMGRERWEASKNACLDALAELVGVDRITLETNAGMAA